MSATEYENDAKFEFEFTSEDIKEFDDRRKKRLNSESVTYQWEQAKKIIIGNQ
jgi:hypothetical protein